MGEPPFKETAQDILVRLFQDVRQDVQSAPVRHSDDDLLDFERGVQHDLIK